MKKLTRILALILIFTMLFPLVSCKKDKDSDTDNYVWDPYNYENLGEFLTLADYKGYSISQAYIDREIDLILAALFDDQNLYVDVNDGREAKEWDCVMIEFLSVSVDGNTLFPLSDDPETEEDESEQSGTYSFTIGTGMVISNINDAVIGMTLNSEKELTFTFPTDYTGTEAYAGKEAVFKFKLIAHKEPPELTDDLCIRYTSYINPEVMINMFTQEIMYSYVWKLVYDNSVLIKAPEKEFNDYYNAFIDPIKSYAKSNNKTLEQYVAEDGKNHPSMGLYDGITMDDFYKLATNYANENVKNDLILHSLVRAEGLKTSGALYDAAQKELMLSYGVGYTIDSLIETYGKTQIVTSIMDIQVRKQVLKHLTVTQ